MTKKLLFILTLFITIPSIAQEYTPMLDTFNEWQVTYCYQGCFTDMYHTDGDTLFDGKQYKILDGYHFISRTFLLREDLASRNVYLNIANRSGSPEYLLYDFSLNIGDSIDIKNPISPFPAEAGFYKLDSIINRPLVDGNQYRHFYLSPTPSNTISSTPAVWVEGVGSLSLINAPGGFPDINNVGQLSCFFKNGELFYSNLDSISGCEPRVLGVESNYNSLENVTLNTIINDGLCEMYNTENIRFVDVFDLHGRKLSETIGRGETRIELNFSSVSAGIYLVVAYSKKFEKKVFKVLVK